MALPESAMKMQEIKPALGSGNALIIRVESEHMTECFTVFGETQSILAKAFRGELVPQDPNDELASVLLEGIRAQRAAPNRTRAQTVVMRGGAP